VDKDPGNIKSMVSDSALLLLLIDDDPSVTDLLRLMLKPTFPNVRITNSGAEGLSMVKDLKPDLVILDLMMPDIDGWEICEKIRGFSGVPVLIISALDKPGMIAEALNSGANDYLIKPITANMLLGHVKKLLKSSE
jgi:two-component system, OmpR family, KDP operon response regulator KdpE